MGKRDRKDAMDDLRRSDWREQEKNADYEVQTPVEEREYPCCALWALMLALVPVVILVVML